MNITIYDPMTGVIQSHLSVTAGDLPNNIGTNFVHGHIDAAKFYIRDGEPVPLPPKPAQHDLCVFDGKEWKVDDQVTEALQRTQRNRMLGAIDRINPIRYQSLSAAQQQELQTYRRQLLDVPQQSGWPNKIQWPTKPAWL